MYEASSIHAIYDMQGVGVGMLMGAGIPLLENKKCLVSNFQNIKNVLVQNVWYTQFKTFHNFQIARFQT